MITMKTLILILSLLSYSTEDIQTDYSLPNYENTTKDFEVLQTINNHRQSLGLSILEMNSYISREAFYHTQNMIDTNTLTHSGFEQRSENIRINLPTTKVGECVSRNFTNPLVGWLNSPPHKQIIETADFNFIGVCYKDDYCTIILAK